MSKIDKKRKRLQERIQFLQDEMNNALIKKTSDVKEINLPDQISKINALKKELNELKEKLKYYEEMIPVNNMGKWSRSVAIESYTKKIFKLEQQIKLNKTKNNE